MAARGSLILAAAVLSLTGCATPPAPPVPSDLPGAFEHAGPAAAQWPAQQWYRDFGSEELDAFIDEAARANTDVAAARSRVTQADARARQAGAALLPSVDANGTANYLAGHSSQGGGHELDWAAQLTARNGACARGLC